MTKNKKLALVYLVTPYTCKEQKGQKVRRRIENERFKIVTEVSVLLIKQGYVVFSPITQSHTQKKIAEKMGISLNGNWAFWREFDLTLLRLCDMVFVLKAPGWTVSDGVTNEIEEAISKNLPVKYITYDKKTQTIKIKEK